ncbi:entericidin A/B family lipoprotein [Oricola cellulosilytica]|uniref:Entericidin A/B family lipoprotein n=1 Tax=Oricola cellulosilytica TaxID=1429082 RepID=A0A4R0PHB3_9HYPH|nr:entericidin A/B family lipoprotein [Oricola cellulosilytica]TCD16408.1 entericidin A/B family lipoprotein [Oricola cellulosilytica]
MTAKAITRTAILATALVALSACANTIRGLGQDTANAVNATQGAASNVVQAAK